jgi:hypothetical protein
MIRLASLRLILLTSLLPVLIQAAAPPAAEAATCERWVAPPLLGDDTNPGTAAAPWASLEHAAEAVPDDSCTVWFNDGTYFGEQRVNRRFTTPTTFRAVHPYRAAFAHAGLAVSLSGARNMTLDGFVFRHTSPAAGPLVVQVDGSAEGYAEQIVLRNNIFHDSYNNDLLKVVSGARFVTVEGNVFYNQGPTDEHIDVNSVTDVVIQDNIFFNDFAGSGREVGASHSFITIKDSDEGADGLEGSERITVRRNIFLNWQGGKETLIQVGNDGKAYHEAEDVHIENNLFVGNSAIDGYSILGLRGVKDIVFANNTAVGDFPSSAYAMWVDVKDLNPVNQNLTFANNIWSDPTGSMGSYFGESDDNEFSKGDPLHAQNIVLDNNLYWNGGAEIPGGDLLTPLTDDGRALVADPLLDTDYTDVVLPRWDGDAFLSGNASIREEFIRLAQRYASVPGDSPAVAMADPAFAPDEDILGRPRSVAPELGAFEYVFVLSGWAEETTLHLEWTEPHEPGATKLALAYWTGGEAPLVVELPESARGHTLSGLRSNALYTIRVVVLNALGQALSESAPFQIRTRAHLMCLPLLMHGK